MEGSGLLSSAPIVPWATSSAPSAPIAGGNLMSALASTLCAVSLPDRRWTRSVASNRSARVWGESARWPLNSARSGSRANTVSTAASHAASSGKTLCASQVKRASTSARVGSVLATSAKGRSYHWAHATNASQRDRHRVRDVWGSERRTAPARDGPRRPDDQLGRGLLRAARGPRVLCHPLRQSRHRPVHTNGGGWPAGHGGCPERQPETGIPPR